MSFPHAGKGTFWELRVRTADLDSFDAFVRTMTGGGVRSILLIRGDTTSEGTAYWMLLNGVLEGHAGVITKIEQQFTASWKPFGVRIFNNYYGQEKDDDYGEEKR